MLTLVAAVTLAVVPVLDSPSSTAPAAAAASARSSLAARARKPVGSGITFLEDDWAGALARGRAEGKPVFVDAWASWCHTCLSMRNFIFPDPGLRELAGRVVWVALDTEKPVNRAFVEKFALEAWPTFFVVDPSGERLVDRWAGAATVGELRRFVLDAVDTFGRKRSPGAASAAVDEALAAVGRGDASAAAAAWERAVALTPPTDSIRPSRLVSLALALARVGTPEASGRCVALGLSELARTGESATVTDFTSIVADCAGRLPEADPQRRDFVERGIARLDKLVASPTAPLSIDDRSDAYANLVQLLDDSGRHEVALDRARARLRMLEKAAASAPDVEKASTFDAHRMEAYLYLGDLAAAEKLLAARERELPDDYNPPARLARVLLKKGDAAAAAAAVDRALAIMPRGRRRLGILDLKVEILGALGRPVTPVLEEKLALYRELPSTQRTPKGLAAIEAALAAARARESAALR